MKLTASSKIHFAMAQRIRVCWRRWLFCHREASLVHSNENPAICCEASKSRLYAGHAPDLLFRSGSSIELKRKASRDGEALSDPVRIQT